MNDSRVPLPYSTPALPGVGGALRTTPEDFEVEEVPAYSPSGEGDHTYLWIEKRGLTTPDAVARLGAALGFDPRVAGVAGMKDRHALTRQWVSVERLDPARAAGVALDGVRVLAMGRHTNRLKTGHLAANRFRILLRDARDAGLAREIAGQLEKDGLANWFGEQRFGRDGDNAAKAREFLSGRRPPPRDARLRRLLASAWQSEVFNRALAERVARGGHSRAMGGDLCVKHASGGIFYERDPALLQPRLDAHEVSVTGPLFGAKMRWPEDEARSFEESLLAAELPAPDALERERKVLPGARRPYRLLPGPIEVSLESEGLRVCFVLPAGAYATIVLRELTKQSE